jgi:uncharacterized protein
MILQGMNIKIMYNVPIPMRDGAILYADIYRPDDDKPYPAIVNRTPYLKDGTGHLSGYVRAHRMAGQGYNVVIQDVRGTGLSDGVCDPAGHQTEDGYDTIEWVALQPWCNEMVGMVGESYHGFSQLAAAQSRPPHLKAICPFQTSWTKFPAIYDFGVFSNVLYGWIYGRALEREKYIENTLSKEALEKMQYCMEHGEEQLKYLPLKDMPAANIPGVPGLDFQNELLENIDNKEYLTKIGRVEGFEDVQVPCLILTGWYDFLRDKTIYNYVEFKKRGGSEACRDGTRLIIGPWTHGDQLSQYVDGYDYGPEAACDNAGITGKLISWFDYWMKGINSEYMSGAPVKLFVLGKNQWRDEYEWPLKRTKYVKYYLHSQGNANSLSGNGYLSTEMPIDKFTDSYIHDPSNPVPGSTGEAGHFMIQDQRPNEQRNDVLVYTSPAFTEETEITGPLQVELYASSSAIDTDFVGKLSDVHPDGRAINLGMKLIRARYRDGETASFLEPEKVYKFIIDVGNISIVLPAGHKIRLDITSSLFPDADVNLNTGGRVGFETEYCSAVQKIYHDSEYPSTVILPMIPQE